MGGLATHPTTVWRSASRGAFDVSAIRRPAGNRQTGEGGGRDTRQFIDPDTLLEMWDQLTLPSQVRAAWANWFRITRGIDLPIVARAQLPPDPADSDSHRPRPGVE